MTFYNCDSDGDYTRAPDTVASRTDRIAPGIYELRVPMMGAPYLHRMADKKPIPEKIYGNAMELADRILTTYNARRENKLNTGVLLEGIKGSGKSLTAAMVVNRIVDAGGFCIVVNKPFPGDILKDIIGTPSQPVVLDFDEFEKIYPRSSRGQSGSMSMAAQADAMLREGRSPSEDESKSSESDNKRQESLLTFLSGGTTSGVLSLITVNDSKGINEFMRRRPSRIFYTVAFDGLPRKVIEEFAQDAINDKSLVQEYARKASRIRNVSFDILTSLAADINLIGKGVSDSMRMMGFADEAQDQYKKMILWKGRDVTRFYDGTGTVTAGKHSQYLHENLYSNAVEAYANAIESGDAKEIHMAHLALPIGASKDVDFLRSLPKKFTTDNNFTETGVEVCDGMAFLVSLVDRSSENVEPENLDALVVVAVSTLADHGLTWCIINTLNDGANEISEPMGGDDKMYFTPAETEAVNALRKITMSDITQHAIPSVAAPAAKTVSAATTSESAAPVEVMGDALV